MSDIGVIDAEIIGKKKHRFPNLASMKISGFHKANGDKVQFLTDYSHVDDFDKVYISKVFTDTVVPDGVLEKKNVLYGGTGFYFDKAENLPYEIEHHMPDYHLYDDWVNTMILSGIPPYQFKDYTDYSIGFMTRGCFRKCPFCVNQKYDKVFAHSPLEEFFDPDRKRICLLDDNIFGYKDWKDIFDSLRETNKQFMFKQGLDERLLTDEKCRYLFSSKYYSYYYFAFDSIKDYDLIHNKLKLMRKHNDEVNVSFYVLVGYESTDFKDIENMWRRIELLMEYKCLPYIMRYRSSGSIPNWENSEFRDMYIAVARWCNQPRMFKKQSFREYCEARQQEVKTEGYICNNMKCLLRFEKNYPDFSKHYFDLKFSDYSI